MFIKTTCMRLSHGPAGTTAVATDYHQMVKWALNLALTGEVSQHVLAMSNNEQHTLHTHHKEESEGRIKADRLSLRNTLDVCINSLDDDSHSDGALLNIVTGHIAHPGLNADDSVSLRQLAMSNFKAGRPGSFYDPFGKLVVTMDVTKTHLLVGKEHVYACLLASPREIIIDDVLAYELAAYPQSVFNPCDEMKIKVKIDLETEISSGYMGA